MTLCYDLTCSKPLKSDLLLILLAKIEVAERGGFEPPIRLLAVYRFSKPAPSATRPSLQPIDFKAFNWCLTLQSLN